MIILRDFVEMGLLRPLIFTITLVLLMSAVWSTWTKYIEYPSCRLVAQLKTTHMHNRSLKECAVLCNLQSDCTTFSYHGYSASCDLVDRAGYIQGCSGIGADGWRTFGKGKSIKGWSVFFLAHRIEFFSFLPVLTKLIC